MLKQIDTQLAWLFVFAIALCASSALGSSSEQINGIPFDKGTYTANGYTADLNPWGAGNLVNGKDYSQTMTLAPATFPNDLQMNWRWKSSGDHVMAYPNIKFVAPTMAQTANLSTLDAHYELNIAGDVQDFNVSFELWLASSAGDDFNAMTHELMIMIHAPGLHKGNQTYTLSNGGLTNATIFINNNWGYPGSHKWTFVVIENSKDKLAGVINIGDVVKTLIWNGVLTGREYINNVQLGAEVSAGSGELSYHHLKYDWNAKPSIIGTSNDHIINVGSMGGNHIVGDAEPITAVYSGLFSTFEIRRRRTETLIMRAGDISSLDVLEHVKFVRFSDGVFDLADETFERITAPK